MDCLTQKFMLFTLSVKLRMSEYTVNMIWKLFTRNILVTVFPLKSTWFSYKLIQIFQVHASCPHERVWSAKAASCHFNQMDIRICCET